MTDVGPEEDELEGRVNTDMEFEDAVKLMLSTDLREETEGKATDA